MTPSIYALITAAIVPSTTTLRVHVDYFTHATNGTTPFYSADYDYDLRDRSITDAVIETDLRRQAAIVADGLRRWQEINERLSAVAGQRVKLADVQLVRNPSSGRRRDGHNERERRHGRHVTDDRDRTGDDCTGREL